MIRVLIKVFFISTFLCSIGIAEEVKVFEFTDDEFKTLELRKVRGADANTEYSLGSNENGNLLKAEADRMHDERDSDDMGPDELDEIEPDEALDKPRLRPVD